tara:strand:- start:592 stop:1002 length:411 start_codon:yes stop_codon:yes gene_type:complete
MNNYNSYTLFKFINIIEEYEDNLILKIKLFLIPDIKTYLFRPEQYVKKVMYEMSDHEHNRDLFLEGKYNQIYCPCYFNKKHKNYNELKKRKFYTKVKINSLEYNKETFEKEYIVTYTIDRVFSNEIQCKENELEII